MRLRSTLLLAGAVAAVLFGCREQPAARVPAQMRAIAGGSYVLGSDSDERRLGYRLAPPTVRQAGWYDAWESSPHRVSLEPFFIDRRPVTQREFSQFVAATGHRVPHIAEPAYVEQGFLVHPYSEVRRFLWHDAEPDSALLDHPVVLVDRDDARAYCSWRGALDGWVLRLPSEAECWTWLVTCSSGPARPCPMADRC